MFTTITRIDRYLLFIVVLAISGSMMVGCEWFPESTFELASESRLQKWITLPPGLARADVSLTMNHYINPWGRDSTFILQDKKGQLRTKVYGKTRVITVNGITDVIEHRKPEPIFYVMDDPAVWKELGVTQK